MAQADIGLIGLAVMGQNLVLNMNDHGFQVAVYNRSTDKVDEFLAGAAKGTAVVGCHSLDALVQSLKTPRRIMLMVRAGEAVDATIASLLPLLQQGDIVIDGGNSHFADSSRRYHWLKEKGICFIGSGVSGGEEGARFGPSIMPGGDVEAWPHVKDIFQAIAAKAGDAPCCEWVGPEGAGHYVKMVHNGIEYGDMQLIAEAYDVLHRGLGLSSDELHQVFNQWNQGVLDSYLIEITANIFTVKDADGGALVDKILDKAGQKGTGKWTAVDALDHGIPLTLISEAVFARALSALKDERVLASSHFNAEATPVAGDKAASIQAVHDALYASKIVSYAQGFMLMREAAKANDWVLDYGAIALMWRGGCIIRSVFLDNIQQAYVKQPELANLLLDNFFTEALKQCEAGWRQTLSAAITAGIPVPAMSSALAFFDGYRSARLPANLLQAQRDYFGAHTYERIDKPRGEYFHTDWTGLNGQATSGSYNA